MTIAASYQVKLAERLQLAVSSGSFRLVPAGDELLHFTGAAAPDHTHRSALSAGPRGRRRARAALRYCDVTEPNPTLLRFLRAVTSVDALP